MLFLLCIQLKGLNVFKGAVQDLIDFWTDTSRWALGESSPNSSAGGQQASSPVKCGRRDVALLGSTEAGPHLNMSPVLLRALVVPEMCFPGSSVASEAWEKVLVCSVVQHWVD